jgi:hypothetical protein
MARKGKKQAEDDLLDWFTITYRSVFIGLGVIVGAAGAALYFYVGKTRAITPAVSESAPPSVTTARFTSIEGNVLVKKAGTLDWKTVEKGMALGGGDLIRATSAASAEITCFDGTVIQLQPGALMTLEKTFEDPATKARTVAALLSVGAGTVQTSTKNVPSSTTEISTPTVKGSLDEKSKAAVDVAESGESDFRMFQGSGRAETKKGQTIQLGPSEGLKVSPGGNAGPKVPLPAVPALVAPPHQAEVVYPDPTRNMTLVWKPVPGATSYHLMLDYSAYFNRPLIDRKDIHESQQEIRGLDLGKYYWRVSAIDKDGVEGGFSAFFGFTVAARGRSDGVAPPLTIESLDVRGNILQVKGRTERGGTITINGQRVDVGADGRFDEYITFEKPGKQEVVIRATGLDGGAREERRSVVVGPQ